MSGVGNGDLYSRCNFLAPGATGGAAPQYILLEKGSEGYKTDLNNFAPSASIAWRPNVQSGFLQQDPRRPRSGDAARGILRSLRPPGPHPVHHPLREQPRRLDLAQPDREYGNADLVPAGESWPVLLSQTNRLYPSSFNPDPTYPIAVGANRADSLNAFAPDIQIARVRTWTVGFARSLSRDMAVEIRYVGNRGDNEWEAINYNTIRGENLVANGFMNEFKLAMANLAANNASGASNRAGSFAYFGSGTGTSPLPIYLAYLNGRTDATNPAAYANAATTWANATIAGRLAAPNPNPTAAAGDLDGNLTRRNQAQARRLPGELLRPQPRRATATT